MEKDNVIPFPFQTERIYEQLYVTLEEENYSGSVDLIEQILQVEEITEELAKLYCICLIELQAYDEIVDFALDIIEEAAHLYDICVPYHIQALYELEKYKQVIDIFDRIDYSKQAMDIRIYYDLAFELNQKLIENYMKQYERAREANDYQTAYLAMKQLITCVSKPNNFMLRQLMEPTIHPLIKTAILLFAMDTSWNESIEIEKFGQVRTIVANRLQEVDEQQSYKEVMQEIQDIEQQNPVLYDLLKHYTYQYFYMMYPFQVESIRIPSFIRALELLLESMGETAEKRSNKIEIDPEMVNEYVKQIQFCSDMYMSIHEA